MRCIAALLSLVCVAGFAAETKTAPAEKGKEDLSESFGHLIGKNMENLGVELDMDMVIKGLKEYAAHAKAAPMSELECIQAITAAQENLFKQQAKDNLEKAELFLAKNSKEKGVIELDKGKLQYRIDKEGTGAAVEEHFTPVIRYTGKFLDGTVFGSSKEDEKISLDETIPGFGKGIAGMKEGEKRTLFIHPDMGYGTKGYLPPNTLLTFEIEVVKAQATLEQEPSVATTPAMEKAGSEIVSKSGDVLR